METKSASSKSCATCVFVCHLRAATNSLQIAFLIVFLELFNA